jgi:transposase
LCRFLDAGNNEAPRHAQLTGVQKAPRHKVAGSWAPAGQRALWGFDVSADPDGGRNTDPAKPHLSREHLLVLLSGDGVGTMAIQRQTGKSKPTIWRWQARFMAEGVDGLLHDATRPSRKKPLSAATIERVVEMTLGEPPGEATHWTGRAMAKAAGISLAIPSAS